MTEQVPSKKITIEFAQRHDIYGGPWAIHEVEADGSRRTLMILDGEPVLADDTEIDRLRERNERLERELAQLGNQIVEGAAASLTWETFWKAVRDSDWNPSPDELRKTLNATAASGADAAASACVTPSPKTCRCNDTDPAKCIGVPWGKRCECACHSAPPPGDGQ